MAVTTEDSIIPSLGLLLPVDCCFVQSSGGSLRYLIMPGNYSSIRLEGRGAPLSTSKTQY